MEPYYLQHAALICNHFMSDKYLEQLKWPDFRLCLVTDSEKLPHPELKCPGLNKFLCGLWYLIKVRGWNFTQKELQERQMALIEVPCPALPWPRLGLALALHWPCIGLALALPWPCIGLALALHWPCLGLALALHWPRLGLALA
jgi:hypothetical protein